MEHCFQILEKNRILVKTENLCRPAPYQQWRKGAFFWYVRFIGSYSTNFSPTRIFQLFNFLHFERNSQLFQNLEILGNLKLKQSQLSSSFSSCKYLLKFSSFKNFWRDPLQLLSNSQLQSQLKTTTKIWKSSKILVWRTIILLKTPLPAKETKLSKKGRIWKKKEKTGN